MPLKETPQIFPHLWYAKEAEEAARFYASIFPTSRVDSTTPLLSESPSGPPGSVLDEMMRDEDPSCSKRVTDALLKMVKIDIATLEKAYDS